MKGLKCLGFLGLFAISLLSLCQLSDANALRYQVNAIPITSEITFDGGSAVENPHFDIYWRDNFAPSFNTRDTARYFESTYSSQSDKCEYNGFRSNGISYDGNHLNMGFVSYRYFDLSLTDLYSEQFNWAKCRQTTPFGTVGLGNIPHPDFDSDSFYGLTPVTTAFYKSLLPYYYDYDHIYLTDSAVSDSGITYTSALKISDLMDSVIPRKFAGLTIPLGRALYTGSINEGRQMEFQGVFRFPGASHSDSSSFHWSPFFLEHGYFKLRYQGITTADSDNVVSGNVDCSLRTTEVANVNTPGSSLQVSFSCPLISPYNFENNQVSFYLDVGIDFSETPTQDQIDQWYIFDTNIDWTFSSAFVITDNDNTPADHAWNEDPTGNNLSQAPGSAIPLAEEDSHNGANADFFSSLANMFNFAFINPFRPIFDLFSSNDNCASIPTLAGMIHSNETTICPWFSSTTRNILTPVFGLASMMLVFGFAVRWLGARSGNFVEDTGDGFDSGGIHIGRRNKK